MQSHSPTTPFGRRSLTLAHVATQIVASSRPPEKVVHKWKIFKTICTARARIGVSERSLSVLNALLTFHPETALSGEDDLVVFPSNQQLALRAHGMPASTLRRHLAALVDAGLIIRRDSPNGKRYARKGKEGGFEDAFGFSLAPLLVRSEEFQQAAERVRAENRALKLLRERITLHRRDIHKLIEAAIEEDVPGDWGDVWRRFRVIVEAIPRKAALHELEAIVGDLAVVRDEVDMLLENFMKTQNPSANESHSEPQQSDSNTKALFEFEPALEKSGATAEPNRTSQEPPKGYPLGFVLKACPEIIDYALDGIGNWRDLMAVAAQVRGYLGVSPSAYEDACHVMGAETAATVVACILQRAQHINSAGGYLRALTEKARAGEFTVGPMLMAAFKASCPMTRMAG